MTYNSVSQLTAYRNAAAEYLEHLRTTHPAAALPPSDVDLPSLASLRQQVNACGLTLRQFFDSVTAKPWRTTPWTLADLMLMHGGVHPDAFDTLDVGNSITQPPDDNCLGRASVKRIDLSEADRAKAAAYLRGRYEAGNITTYALAAEFGLSYSKVYRLLKEAGTAMRPPGCRRTDLAAARARAALVAAPDSTPPSPRNRAVGHRFGPRHAHPPKGFATVPHSSVEITVSMRDDDFMYLRADTMAWAGAGWPEQPGRFVPVDEAPISYHWAHAHWFDNWSDVMFARSFLAAKGLAYQVCSDESWDEKTNTGGGWVILTDYTWEQAGAGDDAPPAPAPV